MIDAQNGDGGGERGSVGRWSQSELARLRRATDPEIDQVAEAFHREHPELANSRDMVRSMIQELSLAKADPEWFIRHANDHGGTWPGAALEVALAPPPWRPDPTLIERGQRAFADNGLYQAGALFFASLPMAYATVDGAEVLARVSDLATQNLTRRVAETGQMLLDVMGLRGRHSLEPGAPGYMTAIGLRLMHACVRVLILDQPEPYPWRSASYGPPVNQELLLGTLLDFTVVSWEAMARMGVMLTNAEREANLHTWSYIGLLMGVEACRAGPLSLADVEQISTGLARQLRASEAGQRLMAALLSDMEEFMPLGWRKVPRSVVHWLFRDAPDPVRRVPDMLNVPPAAWWAIPLLASLRVANQDSWLFGRLARALMRKLGRHVLIGYADRYSNGREPFRVPSELDRRWRIRTTPARIRIRRVRHHVRHATRTRVPRRGKRGTSQGMS